MKLCLAILLVSCIAIGAHGSRVKRGLNADEQKKFLDELNEDRRKVAQEGGTDYVPMKYDASLEKEVVNTGKCLGLNKHWLPLRNNDVAEGMRKHCMDASGEGDIYQDYFNPNYDIIGCSKEAKCTEVLNESNCARSRFEGKTIEYHGMCELGKSDPRAKIRDRRKNIRTPSPNKYGDILGIPAISGAGSFLSLSSISTISLYLYICLTISLFLVLYI